MGVGAEFVAQAFRTLGLTQVEVDDFCNVYGLLPGQYRDRPAVMVSAHTDTVFPEGTDLSVRREGNLIYGPGLGDNSMGVAGLLRRYDPANRSRLATDDWLAVATAYRQ